ncbi:MAG: HAMP domain-containing histidine kinase [Lachnospiraceae bacterium]|nr:HAMP domain-containing histidine kinase [Lachnospiraceae bacterium]
MIKTLKKRFVLSSMAAITLLIIVVLGGINVANAVRIRNENDAVLEGLVSMGGERRNMNNPGMNNPGFDPKNTDTQSAPDGAGNGGPDSNDSGFGVPGFEGQQLPEFMQPEGDFGDRRFKEKRGLFNLNPDEDELMSARYFAIRYDSEGNIIYTNVENISSVDEEEAEAIAAKAYASGNLEGKLEGFKYVITISPDRSNNLAIFLDVSKNRRSILYVALISAAVGLLAEIAMLLLVLLLSRKAIEPIAANMERQKRFVTDAGHEIKTPLAIIRANTDAMELHNGENKWSRNIKTQTDRLSGLMKNMLTLAKSDDGTLHIVKEELDLSTLVEDTAAAFYEPAKLKGLKLEPSIEPEITYRASKEQMVQLVSLLLDNSVKYASDKGPIRINLARSSKGVKLEVSNAVDNPESIDTNKLFDRFYRADEARTQKSGGYGIGLSVVASICESHHGKAKAVIEDDRIVFKITLGERKRDIKQ